MFCPQCNTSLILNPKPVAVLFVPVYNDTSVGVIAVRRNIEPRKGFLSLISGYIEIGETWEQAACREAREEACIDIEASTVRFLSVGTTPDTKHILLFGRTLSPLEEKTLPSFAPNVEVSERVVVRKGDVVDWAFPTHKEVVDRYFKLTWKEEEPSSHFQRWVTQNNFKFYFAYSEEDSVHFIGFGHRTDGFIDDGWFLRPEEKSYWNDEDEYHAQVLLLLKPAFFGGELGDCSYEIRPEEKDVIRAYLTRLGFSEGTPKWKFEEPK